MGDSVRGGGLSLYSYTLSSWLCVICYFKIYHIGIYEGCV